MEPPAPEPESTPPAPESPATFPKPESTFTIKPIKIPQFIAEIWFLCRAFARVSPMTHSITCSCSKEGGVPGVALQLLNHDSRQILAALHIAPKNLECDNPLTFETMKIFTIFQEIRSLMGRNTPVTVSLHSTQAAIMDGRVSYHEPELNIYSRVSYGQEPFMESYYRHRGPRMYVELKKFNQTFNRLMSYESFNEAEAQNLHVTADVSSLKISMATTSPNPVPVEHCSKEHSGKKTDMELNKFDIRALLDMGLEENIETITLVLSRPYLVRIGNRFCFAIN